LTPQYARELGSFLAKKSALSQAGCDLNHRELDSARLP
jgi:hypothetical protein